MKWLHAKRANALIILLTLLVAATGYCAWREFFPSQISADTDIRGEFQMGFYDLMSQRKEIYDSSMRTMRGTLLSTITSPDDNRFVFKGKFTQMLAQQGKLYFRLSPIYYTTPQKGLMIDGLMDLLMHTSFWMMPIEAGADPLIVGQTGSILLSPAHKPPR